MSRQSIYPVGELQHLGKPNIKNIVTEFQTGHGFAQSGAASSTNTGNTTDFVLGNQALSTVSDGLGGVNRITNTLLSALNATNKCVAVYFKLQNVAHLSSTQGLRIYAFSGSNTNNFNYWAIQFGGDSNPIYQEGVWAYLTLNFADITGSGGTFDKSNITGMQINFADDNTGQNVTLGANGIWLVPDGGDSFPNGVVSITFDDGWRGQYNVAKPILDIAGLAATAYPIVSLIGTSKYMTHTQIDSLREYSGWEVGAHSFTDTDHSSGFANLSAEVLAQDFAAIKYYMHNKGHYGAHDLAYPLGSYNQSVINVVRKYFRSARSIFGRTNETINPANPYRLRAQTGISEASATTPTAINSMITRAAANRGWLILTFHKIIPTATSLSMSGTTATMVFPQAIPWTVGDSITLAGFTPSGLNGTFTIATISADAKTITFTIAGSPASASVIGTAVSSSADCSQAGFQSIVNQLVSSGIAIRTVDEVMRRSQSPTLPSQFYRTPVADKNYTVTSTDRIVAYSSLTAARAITLPSAAGANTNMLVTIKDESGSCSATNTLTISTSSAQTIDGASSYVISVPYGQVTLASNGTNWDIVASDVTFSATTPKAPSGSAPTAGSLTSVARSDHIHPRYDWQPADHNLLAWNYDVSFVSAGSVLPAAGTVYAVKLHTPVAISVTNILLYLQAIGVTLTSNQCFAGIYQNGTLLGSTADQAAAWAGSAGLKTIAISGGAVAVAAGDFYIAVFANGSTLPAFGRLGSFSTANNAGLTTPNLRYASADTGRTTSLPGSMGGQTSIAQAYWAGVS